MHRSAFPLIASLVLAGVAVGQQMRVVPTAAASADGNTLTPYFSGYGAGRAQQVLEATSFTKATGLIREINLRADGSQLQVLASRSLAQLTLTLGYTSMTAQTLTSTFATNRTGTQTTVFSGGYTLPAQDAVSRPFNIQWKLASPFVYVATLGNLLVEWDVPGMATKGNYFLDAHQASASTGTATPFGKAGAFGGPESYAASCADVAQLTPGGSAQLLIAPFTKQYPAAAIWGFSNTHYGPLPLPFDLTPLGAPGNHLNVSMELVLPMPLTAGRGGWEGRSALAIPNDNGLRGLTVYAQGLFLDATANARGWVLSQGVAMTLATGSLETQLLGSYDSTQTTGYLMGAGTGLVVQLVGAFQ